jgi:hypothetical protein
MTNELDRARSALHGIPCPSSYEEWNKIGIAAVGAGLSLEDIDAWSATGTNYGGTKAVRANFKGVSANGGVGAGSLFRFAFEEGWSDSSRSKGKTSATKPASAKPVDAMAVWERFDPAHQCEHPYVAAKHGKPDNLRVVPASDTLRIAGKPVAGYLAVPAWGMDGNTLNSIQFIPPAGGPKLNLPRASFEDGVFVVGDLSASTKAFICEGIGQAWACNAATGQAAVVCFGLGRMASVAAAVHAAHPDKTLVIVPDADKEVQASEIARGLSGEWIELPAGKPNNFDVNDFSLEHGVPALTELLTQTRKPAMRYTLLTDTDLAETPPMKWRIKGVLPDTGLAVVFGASGSGKSFLVLDMLQAIAAGASWYERRSEPCPVVYCALEGEAGVAGRVAAYRKHHGSASSGVRYLTQPFSLLEPADIRDLAGAIIASGRAQVTVLDTLNRAAPGSDENDSRSMGLIIAAAKQLQALTGGLVILVHHSGKDQTKGMRGHSSLHAALDAVIEVRRDGDSWEWRLAKSKDSEDGLSHPFALKVVGLGTDSDGDAITSCVAVPKEEITNGFKRTPPPKAGNQKVVWDCLGEIFRKAGEVRPEGAPATLPAGRPCITLEAAVAHARTKLICEPKRQTERAQMAIRGLCDRGLLVHEGGYLWCK